MQYLSIAIQKLSESAHYIFWIQWIKALDRAAKGSRHQAYGAWNHHFKGILCKDFCIDITHRQQQSHGWTKIIHS